MKMVVGIVIGAWITFVFSSFKPILETRETEKVENSLVFGIEVPRNLPPIKYMIVKPDGSVQWGYLSHKEKP